MKSGYVLRVQVCKESGEVVAIGYVSHEKMVDGKLVFELTTDESQVKFEGKIHTSYMKACLMGESDVRFNAIFDRKAYVRVGKKGKIINPRLYSGSDYSIMKVKYKEIIEFKDLEFVG